MKVLYLDYDGVMHDSEVYYHPKRGIYMKTEGCVLFEWMPILEELLLPHPDVRIVLSTSWVREFRFSFAKKHLSQPLQDRVIGATFHKEHMRKENFAHLPRGEQIVGDVSRRKPKSWFAIDDDAQHWPQCCRDKLIHTDSARGISCPEVQKSIRTMLEIM